MLPDDKADFPEMLRGIRELVSKRVPAESVVAAVANSLARARYPLLPRLSGGSWTLSRKAAVVSFAEWLLAMELNDAGFWLSSAYAQLVKAKKREKRAMFFTPPILGDRILDDLEKAGVDWGEAKIIDLACGGAAFLAPAARRMADALAERGVDASGILVHVRSHLVGIEIEPFLAKLSQFFVGMTLYPWVEAVRRPPAIAVALGDALKYAPPLAGKFDAVICNPPYRKLTSREVAALPSGLRELCYLQPNLYGVFMALSVQLLNEHGVAGLLTPTSFSSGKSFLRLRAHLAAQRHVAQIDIVGEKEGVFWGVEQETAISLFAAKVSGAADTNVFVGTANAEWKKTGSVVLDNSGAPWILPRHEQDVTLLSMANGRTMADYGYSATVGDVVLHRDRRRRFPTLKAAQLAKAVKPVPMLRASEIRVSGKLEFERMQRPDCYIDVGSASQGLVSGPAVALQRVTSLDQGRRLICAPVPRPIQEQHGGVVGENHVNFLVATSASAVRPALLAKILGSEPVDRLFRCRSGATNVSVYELTHLPLPDPDVVRKELASGADIDTAVWAGFGIDARPTRK
jgi:adenine-specific DNA-methyltransferase